MSDKTPPDNTPEEDSDIKQVIVQHKLSKAFVSCYASGAILHHSQALWQIMFYSDCAYANSETLTFKNGKQVEGVSTVPVEGFREDLARISLTPETARDLYNLLGHHLNGEK